MNAIPADLIYGEADTYTTGFQRPRHLEDLITTAVARQDPAKAIDVGCNDGTLMENLRRAGYRQVVGVEPNAIAAELARKKGYNVYTSYLTEAQAQQIVAKHGEFDTVFLRHVVEHVSDLERFLRRQSGRCCGTMACWSSNCPKWRRASGSAALPSCGKST